VARVAAAWLLGLLLLAACSTAAPPAAPEPAAPTAAVAQAAGDLVSASSREDFATHATWAPGQLQEHFAKHPEGYRSVEDYDRGARATIRLGAAFTYLDREAGVRRLGFYDPDGNRFTSLTRDGRRITTHFRPERGAAYVRQLPDSTYR
jgi:pyocin large subunit-like protein